MYTTIQETQAQSVHLEHQYRISQDWTVSAWLAGNFQVSYGSSRIHSVSVFASPRRHWLCSTKKQTADVSRDKNIQGFMSVEGTDRSVGPLRVIHRCRNMSFKNYRTARRKCVEHQHVWTINEYQSADPRLATAQERRYIGNRCKQLQSGVVEESRVPEAVSAWNLELNTPRIFLIFRRP